MLQPSFKFSNTKLLVIILPTKKKKEKDLHGFHGFLPNRILIYIRKIEIQIICEIIPKQNYYFDKNIYKENVIIIFLNLS